MLEMKLLVEGMVGMMEHGDDGGGTGYDEGASDGTVMVVVVQGGMMETVMVRG